MKPAKFDYVAPDTLDEALDVLRRHGDEARVLAGGQSLVPALNFRLQRPALLVDLARVSGLRYLSADDGGDVRCGAMTTHRDVEFSALAQRSLPLIHAAMPLVAHPAIRTRGTIGGSVAHADPAADWPALLLACDATIVLTSATGTRALPARDFGRGLFETALAPGELVTEIRFPAWPHARRWSHRKMTRRRGDFAIVGVACTVDIDASGRCTDARIAVYGASDRAMLVETAAASLRGEMIAARHLDEAGAIARASFDPPADLHASAAFRRQLVEVLTRRALAQALDVATEEAR